MKSVDTGFGTNSADGMPDGIDPEPRLVADPMTLDEFRALGHGLALKDPPPLPPPPRPTPPPADNAVPTDAPAPEERIAAKDADAAPKTRIRPPPIPMLQLRMEAIIRRANYIFTYEPLPFFCSAFLALLPGLVFFLGVMPLDSLSFQLLAVAIQQMVAGLFIGVASYSAYQIVRENTVQVGEAFSKGLAHFLPIALVSILATVITSSGYLPAFLAVDAGLDDWIAVPVFAVIPALAFTCMLLVAVPACIVERLGPIASIRRSLELTKGYRWAIFWVLFCWGLISTGIAIATAISIGLIIGFFASPVFVYAVYFLVGLYIISIANIICAIIYLDLRRLKDGVTVDKLVSVFD